MSVLTFERHRILVGGELPMDALAAAVDDYVFRFDASRPRRLGLDSSDRVQLWLGEEGDPGVGAARAVQDTAGNRATYGTRQIGNYPAVDFDGSSDAYSTTIAMPVRPLTILAVVKPDSFASMNRFVVSPQTNSACGLFVTQTSGVISLNGTNVFTVNSTLAASTTDPSVIGFAASTTNVKFVRNADREDVANSSASAASTASLLGQFAGGSGFYDGILGELLIWGRELSTGDLDDVVGHLMAKWGIS